MQINARETRPAIRKADNSGSLVDFDVTGCAFIWLDSFGSNTLQRADETLYSQVASLHQLKAAT
jgi:hypothetical protein